MTPRLRLFAIGLWVGVGLILAYEFYALSLNQGVTISEIFWQIATVHPVLPFALGFLCGHFVWQSADVYEFAFKDRKGDKK